MDICKGQKMKNQVNNQHIQLLGIKKVFAYLYLIVRAFFHYSLKLITFKMNPYHFIYMLVRLIYLLKILWPNKPVWINGKIRYQLYIPSFPSKAFYHALNKFSPQNKNPVPITVVFSMTKACSYNCPYCYQKTDRGSEVKIEILKAAAREMQEMGVTLFDIEGGEPMIRFERLLDLLSVFDERSEVWVNTTGHTLTDEKAKQMKDAGVYGVFVSIHNADKKLHDEFVGFEGAFEIAKEAVKIFKRNGIIVAINYCPSLESVKSDGVEKMMELGREIDATLIQVIHAKSSGGWLYEKDEVYASNELLEKLHNLHYKYNESKIAHNYPSILFQVFEESPEAFGCTAGIDRFYLNHEGEVQPCEFINVSYGNINNENIKNIMNTMSNHHKIPGEKWLCCSESESIGRCIKDNNLLKTPIPKEHTCKLVKSWDKGNQTKIYKKLKIYKDS